ncbi:IS21-like element helper ATPase IstB [Fusibacter sp. 3D3]|uniref:IS21-like element helper ATPase IstB n=1 Tax=Fusibacter sp. 3D3 TaxID=1048380 RepID=UPI000855C567|nr:IS21-like element helper ATPase IstB [Fusibacter sp. 3D3]GAU79591.1 mobile element protein [Fusibacter sp. 3D3]
MQQLVIENKTDYIEAMMKKFKLVDVREQYSELIDEAETASMGYLDFLVRLLSVEEEGKKSRRYERLLDKACFESTSKLEEIDYDFNPTIDRDKIEELGSLRFMEANENIIVIGPPGVGKSMIATGIGRNACKNGHRVLFVNAKALVDRLHDEMLKGTLPETLENINKIDLLIVDELSYISMDKERESLFFQIIRQRYEKRSLIITTNLPMGRWNELFTGQLAATAILDRLLHHCHVLSITGDSYRVKGSKYSVKTRKDIE